MSVAPVIANKYYLNEAEIQQRYTVENCDTKKYKVLTGLAVVLIIAAMVTLNIVLGLQNKVSLLLTSSLLCVVVLPPLANKFIVQKVYKIYLSHKENAKDEKGVLDCCKGVFAPYAPESAYIFENTDPYPHSKGLYARFAYWNNKVLELQNDVDYLEEKRKTDLKESGDSTYSNSIAREELIKKRQELVKAKAKAAYFSLVYTKKHSLPHDFTDICKTFNFEGIEIQKIREDQNPDNLFATDPQEKFDPNEPRNAGITLAGRIIIDEKPCEHLPWKHLLDVSIPDLAAELEKSLP